MCYGIKGLYRSGVVTLLLFVCAPALAAGPGRGGAAVVDGISLYHVGKVGNLCAITFDDGPSRHTGRLLDILRERGIRATFFMLGKSAERNPTMVKRVLDDGHELANHTYSHKTLRHMPYAEQVSEIQRVQTVLAEQGATSRFVRPPFGRYDSNTVKIVEQLGLKVALWSVDSHDWQRRANVDRLESIYGQNAQNGIILFHDTHEQTVDAMPEILDALVANQCRFVTVSQFMEYAENSELLQALAAEPLPSLESLQPLQPVQSGQPSQFPQPLQSVPPAPALQPPHRAPQTVSSAEPQSDSTNVFVDTFRQFGNWAQGLMRQGG